MGKFENHLALSIVSDFALKVTVVFFSVLYIKTSYGHW